MSTRYWRLNRFDGVDLLWSKASTHRYARHSHEGYAFGVVEDGAHAFTARGKVWTAVPGRIIIVNPNDAHDGGPAARNATYSYRMIYVDWAVLGAALDQATGPWSAMPLFPESVVDDAGLAERLLRLHRAFEEMETRLECEALLITTLVELRRRHGKTGRSDDRSGHNPRAVRLALDYLSSNFAEDCSLSELAALAGVDRFHLLRSFRHCLGLPPHLYQTQLRLRRVKRLMLAGEPPAIAAVAAGFADQSHMIRKFKAAYGVTPGEFLGSGADPARCNNVQSVTKTEA